MESHSFYDFESWGMKLLFKILLILKMFATVYR